MEDREIAEWKVNTPSLLKEILVNPGTSVLRIPLAILGNILNDVALRSSQLNDPVLNGLMCRLALYEIADQYSKEYDGKLVKSTMKKYEQTKKKLKDGE